MEFDIRRSKSAISNHLTLSVIVTCLLINFQGTQCFNESTFFSFQHKELSTENDVEKLEPNNPVVIAMATCHSLTIVENRVVGDPLDVKMFEFTNWVKSGQIVFFFLARGVVFQLFIINVMQSLLHFVLTTLTDGRWFRFFHGDADTNVQPAKSAALGLEIRRL
jgi:magnesium-transporting ATPase (P-type)